MPLRRVAGGRLLPIFVSIWTAAGTLPAAGGQPEEAASRNSWERGKMFYTERCVLCHGQDGRGWDLTSRIARPPVPVPDLTDPSFMRGVTDRELLKIIKEGGTRLGKSRFMPPTGQWLSDDEIRDIIAYVRSLERRPASGQR